MCRGNGGTDIFRSDADRRLFLDTLDEACDRCGWRIHAFVLMDNHYHLLLETPKANLVTGMKWFQGTYTQRFNRRHRRRGHLFQGRYRALVVDGSSGDYFAVVSSYIHLNPVRAFLFDTQREPLESYFWSSYPFYLNPVNRPGWLCVERVLGNFQWRDDDRGRETYGSYMNSRVAQVVGSADPAQADVCWNGIRRGWYLGDEGFRDKLLAHVESAVNGKQRSSFSGEAMRGHDEAEAERLVGLGLDALGLTDNDLAELKKNSPQKYAIAWLVRRNTCVRNGWIKERLEMGKATNFAAFLKEMEQGGYGADIFEKIKNIKS